MLPNHVRYQLRRTRMCWGRRDSDYYNIQTAGLQGNVAYGTMVPRSKEKGVFVMSFVLPVYRAPDFTQERFCSAPDAVFQPAPRDGVAPENYHATSIYPEYFKVGGRGCWRRRAAWTAWPPCGTGRSPWWSSAT